MLPVNFDLFFVIILAHFVSSFEYLLLLMSKETLVEELVIWGIKFLRAYVDSPYMAGHYLDVFTAAAQERFLPTVDDHTLLASLSQDPLLSALQRIIFAAASSFEKATLTPRLQAFRSSFETMSSTGDLASQVRELGCLFRSVMDCAILSLGSDAPLAKALKPFQTRFPDLSVLDVHPESGRPFLPETSSGLKRSLSTAELQIVTPRPVKARAPAGHVRTPQTGRQEASGEAIYVFPDDILTKPRSKSPQYPEFSTVDYFHKSRVFVSLKAFKDYLQRDALMCDVSLHSGHVGPDGCTSIDLFCTHTHEENIPGLSFLHITTKAKNAKWRCAWRARARLAADGRVALYEPVFVNDPRPFALSRVNSVTTDDRVELRNGRSPMFVSNCGHTHTLDGSGCHTLPLGLTETVSELLRTIKSPLLVTNALKSDSRFVPFKAKIDDCVANLRKKRTAAPESVTLEQFLRNMEIRHNCVGIILGDSLENLENKPVYITVHLGGLGSVVMQTRGWALELLAKSPACYTDATFGVFLRRMTQFDPHDRRGASIRQTDIV